MTTYYVRSDAGGAGDGSANNSTDAWTLAQALQAGSASFPGGHSDLLLIVADADYTGINYLLQPAAAVGLICGANSSGVIDGTKPTLQYVSSGGSFANVLAGFAGSMSHLSVDFNGLSQSFGFSECNLQHVDITGGANVNTLVRLVEERAMDVSADGGSGTTFQCIYAVLNRCVAKNGGTGFTGVNDNCDLTDCVALDCTTGFNEGSAAFRLRNCVAYRASAGGTGFDISANASLVENCLSVNHTTAYSVNSNAVLLNNYATGATTNVSGTPSSAGDSSVTASDPGLVDPTGTPPDFGTSALLSAGVSEMPFEINTRQTIYAGLSQVIGGGGSGPLPGIGSAFIRSR